MSELTRRSLLAGAAATGALADRITAVPAAARTTNNPTTKMNTVVASAG